MSAAPVSIRGGVVEDDQFARAAIFVQLHRPATTFPVAYLRMCTTLSCPSSMLSTTTSRTASTLHSSHHADGGLQPNLGTTYSIPVVVCAKEINTTAVRVVRSSFYVRKQSTKRRRLKETSTTVKRKAFLTFVARRQCCKSHFAITL